MAQRIAWIDIAKGFGILLVVWGHLSYNDWIYSFHMPLFFFLSGICLNNKRSFHDFALRRVKSLLLPYIYFGLLLTVLELGYRPFNEIITNLTTKLFNYGAMWFIPVLFVSELVFYPISKITKKHVILLIIFISAFIGWACYHFNFSLPLSLTTCFAALSFYGLGYILKDSMLTRIYNVLTFIVLLSAHWILLFLSNYVIDMNNNTIPQPYFLYPMAIAGVLAFCVICIKLTHINTGGGVEY
jgi:fucose 4-O-acetylase-like acetyltransferase